MRVLLVRLTLGLVFIAGLHASADADTIRKRYTFDYDRTTRRASTLVATTQARKQLLRDYLAQKFSSELTERLAEDIDIALDPPEQFLANFKVVSERLNQDESEITLTVEGELDLSSIVEALVQNRVLSFGKESPRVMVLPSPRFQEEKPARTIRALINDRIRQSGLRPVAFERTTETFSVKLRQGEGPGDTDRQALIRRAMDYGADYLIYIDPEVDSRPFSRGGYIADVNFIYTILRPGGSLILGEAVVSERGSGSSAMLAFDRALDTVAPTIARLAISQLYEAIYSDSDVIYDTPQALEEKTIVIHSANSDVVQAVIESLQRRGTSARLGTGTSGLASRLRIETNMDDLELFRWFNDLTLNVDGRAHKFPVVAYSENLFEVEPVVEQAKTQRPAVTTPPRRRPARPPRRISTPAPDRPVQPGEGDTVARCVLKLRPAQFNR